MKYLFSKLVYSFWAFFNYSTFLHSNRSNRKQFRFGDRNWGHFDLSFWIDDLRLILTLCSYVYLRYMSKCYKYWSHKNIFFLHLKFKLKVWTLCVFTTLFSGLKCLWKSKWNRGFTFLHGTETNNSKLCNLKYRKPFYSLQSEG